MEKLAAPIFTETQWELAQIRADIEQKKAEGTLSEREELEIVLRSLYLINQIHEDTDDLHRAQKLFWRAKKLPVHERIQTLWEALDLFIS